MKRRPISARFHHISMHFLSFFLSFFYRFIHLIFYVLLLLLLLLSLSSFFVLYFHRTKIVPFRTSYVRWIQAYIRSHHVYEHTYCRTRTCIRIRIPIRTPNGSFRLKTLCVLIHENFLPSDSKRSPIENCVCVCECFFFLHSLFSFFFSFCVFDIFRHNCFMCFSTLRFFIICPLILYFVFLLFLCVCFFSSLCSNPFYFLFFVRNTLFLLLLSLYVQLTISTALSLSLSPFLVVSILTLIF